MDLESRRIVVDALTRDISEVDTALRQIYSISGEETKSNITETLESSKKMRSQEFTDVLLAPYSREQAATLDLALSAWVTWAGKYLLFARAIFDYANFDPAAS